MKNHSNTEIAGTQVKTTRCAEASLLVSALTFFALTYAAHAQFYAVTDLGTLGGTNALAYGINNHEQIVGTAQTSIGDFHGFMFSGGQMMDLGTLGGSNSWAYSINDNGWMAGTAEWSGTNMHAFLCTNAQSGMMDLGTLGGSNSAAWMINMHNAMVGWAQTTNGSQHAFFMTNFMFDGMMDLGTGGGTNSQALCINSNGMVVGYAMMTNGMMEPLMSSNAMFGGAGMMTMSMGGMGALGGQSWFVNDQGETAGQAQMPGGNQHAFVSGAGGMMGSRDLDLGTLGGSNSIAYCLNNAGTAVGMSQISNGMMHAFMVTNALGGMPTMMDLNDLIPTNSGWMLMEARGINANGQIVGWGMHVGHTNAFLLTPVSGPVQMMSAPATQVVGPSDPVSLQMQMNSSEPLMYQWMQNGVPIPGATNATFSLPDMGMDNAGQYTVTARNSVGTVASSTAAVGMFSMIESNGSPQLMVAAPTGSHFQIDYTDMLGSGANWQTLTNFTMMGSMNQMPAFAPSSGPVMRFYRAMMVP